MRATIPLVPEVKSKWAKALRSGEYSQTQTVLRDDHGHCCLGVLCELAVKEGVIPPPTHDDREGWTYGTGFDKTTGSLPVSVQDWAFGVSDDSGRNLADPLLGGISAAEWNDAEEATFDQIADLIERHL